VLLERAAMEGLGQDPRAGGLDKPSARHVCVVSARIPTVHER
jgi:hypothetical protein